MKMSKKLKIGDKVHCTFLGEGFKGEIIEIQSPKTYKVKLVNSNNSLLPNVGWYEKPKKEKDRLPWYIHEKIK
tara:strand:+ start:1542 stop:1760 length:219 start_codon:yes stop_codon:yes gene_type:complete